MKAAMLGASAAEAAMDSYRKACAVHARIGRV
jgi:hypothetical protein